MKKLVRFQEYQNWQPLISGKLVNSSINSHISLLSYNMHVNAKASNKRIDRIHERLHRLILKDSLC